MPNTARKSPWSTAFSEEDLEKSTRRHAQEKALGYGARWLAAQAAAKGKYALLKKHLPKVHPLAAGNVLSGILASGTPTSMAAVHEASAYPALLLEMQKEKPLPFTHKLRALSEKMPKKKQQALEELAFQLSLQNAKRAWLLHWSIPTLTSLGLLAAYKKIEPLSAPQQIALTALPHAYSLGNLAYFSLKKPNPDRLAKQVLEEIKAQKKKRT